MSYQWNKIFSARTECPWCKRKLPKGWHKARSVSKGRAVAVALAKRKAEGKPIGRPKQRDDEHILELRRMGFSIRKIAKAVACSSSSVQAAIKGAK